ncbi:putative FMN/FAD exporter YeeO [Caprobacter fermentans]|uniref:MATE family efflux transporter n=1 Tax=Caproicibacter fermentans TaxID=2576756 RepID=A0A6N8I3Q8_9FIRM|nr:MATE family efflux transporter [Caproicibacter fermentans]MVB12786.1 putative FMN/FAD exporter YeeO [Caproicibacter fermentans]QNK40313.1 MATE family efflux transporter [Caproicibacter fermentans]
MQELEFTGRRGFVFSITWPIFVELVLQMLVGNADQMMVSRYSQSAVGAVSNANQMIGLLILFFNVVSMASTILITQYIGAGKPERAEEIYSLSLFVNLLAGLGVSGLLMFCSRPIYTLMKVPGELMDQTCLYSSIVGGGMVFQSLYVTFIAFFRSNAMMKVTMFVSAVLNLANIGGNFILINGFWGIPALGVAGAAISSDISRLIGLFVIVLLFRRLVGARISMRALRPFPLGQLNRLLRIGLPSGGESISYNLSQLAIQAMCNLFPVFVINTKAYAGTFAMITYIFASAISQATQIMVGYLMGACRAEDANRRVMATLKLAVAVSFLISVLLYFGSDRLFGLFTDDADVIRLGRRILAVEMILEIGRAINIVLVGALQAAGDIRFPIYVSVIGVWFVAVGAGYLLGVWGGWGLSGMWAAMAADECIRGAVLLIRWRRGKWRSRNLLA